MATAQELAETLRARSGERRARAEARAARLRGQLATAARMLVDRYGASQVFLFGSLADGSFSEASDVDLAATGMRAAGYFDALAELMQLFGAPVDLVRFEEAPPSLRDRILVEGRLL